MFLILFYRVVKLSTNYFPKGFSFFILIHFGIIFYIYLCVYLCIFTVHNSMVKPGCSSELSEAEMSEAQLIQIKVCEL